jgi:NADH-quinone oxidoreductase subunit E
MALSKNAVAAIEQAKTRYPPDQPQAALLPALHIAQAEVGWLPLEIQEEIAGLVGVKPSHVREVVTFYTMFKDHPVGRHHIQVCRSVSCCLRGADKLAELVQERYGLKPDSMPSADGRFSLELVECLASCGSAPVVQINDDYHESMDAKTLVDTLEKL